MMISSTHASGQGGPSRYEIVEPFLDVRVDECIIDEAGSRRVNKIWANHSAKIEKHWRGQARDTGEGSWPAPYGSEGHHFAFKRGSPCPFHGVFGGGWCEVVVDPKGDEDPITACHRSAESIHSVICGGTAITQRKAFALQIHPGRLVNVRKPVKGGLGQDSGSTAW